MFYRRTLEDSADLILFAREMEQTKRYFTFEIARFGEDRVAMEVDIEPDVDDMMVPPFLIQPLVENAVRHAMPSEGKLTISVTGQVKGDDVIAVSYTHLDVYKRQGHYSAWPVYLVSLLTGNAGKPGAAIGQSEEYLPQMLYSNSAAACSPKDSSGKPCRGQANLIHTVQIADVLETGKLLGEDLTIKSAYIHCSNPVVTMCDHDYTTGWFDKLEFVVVADLCMTETCKHADIVLPSAHWFEQVDLGFLFSTHPYLLWQDKCVEPLGESKPDFQIFGLLCEKMGLGEFWNITEEEYLETLLDSEYWKSVGCTVEKLKSEKAARIYPEGDKIASAEVFGTETGRISLYQDTVKRAYVSSKEVDESIERGLHWETPTFAGEDRAYRETYPFHLLSELSLIHI